MSRAFVKEEDNIADEVPERMHSPHPNYVTPRGLAQLHAQLQEIEEALAALGRPVAGAVDADGKLVDRQQRSVLERNLRYVRERVARAIPINLAQQPRDHVAFGAVVDTVDDDEQRRRFEIVGEDEADPAKGKLSWVSPLARALTDAGIGEVVTWKRPAGDIDLEIAGISYPAS
ncbi:MAG TPA: GreA/GreB family elongation factor [Dongiaceae bacterium]|nr:GreA/GreB family elongation factor [Dongiaceae bacterium]